MSILTRTEHPFSLICQFRTSNFSKINFHFLFSLQSISEIYFDFNGVKFEENVLFGESTKHFRCFPNTQLLISQVQFLLAIYIKRGQHQGRPDWLDGSEDMRLDMSHFMTYKL